MQAAALDGNGNAPEEHTISTDSLPSNLKNSGMMSSSSASDSGCMMESGSSTATTDDDRKVINMDDELAGDNNNRTVLVKQALPLGKPGWLDAVIVRHSYR